MKKILFVCSQNRLRSPTAETVFSTYSDWEVRSAGLNNDAVVPLGLDDIIWAEYIFVMERVHLNKIRNHFSSALKDKRLINLDIPDEYEYMDENLIKILIRSVPKYIR